jgi:hypothetical protein
MPVRFVDRSLTLPRLMLSPRLDFTYDRPVDAAMNLGMSVALGATDFMTLGLSVNVPLQSSSLPAVHEFTFQGIFRLLHTDMLELGARADLGAFTIDGGGSPLLHATAMVPFALRIAHVFRLDVGAAVSLLLPTDGDTPIDAALATYGTDPAVAGPGIPVSVTVQIIEPLFAGVDTGFGMLSFNSELADDLSFAPLGFRFGGTIPIGKRPLLDLVAHFNFPQFLLGGYITTPRSDFWETGLSAQVYAPL